MAQASAWIDEEVPAGSEVYLGYFCFNDGAFFEWMRLSGLNVPGRFLHTQSYRIWWGHRSAVRGRRGYACLTEGDVPSMFNTLNLAAPGEGTNPFADPAFAKIASFGSGSSRVDVFSFDLVER